MGLSRKALRVGACYSNGGFGKHWSVRQVIALRTCDDGGEESEYVNYKVLVGENRRGRSTLGVASFLRWAKYEVVRNETSWERVRRPVG